MGALGDPNGYFQDPEGLLIEGLLIEIIDDTLLKYLEEHYRLSIGSRQEEKMSSKVISRASE